MMSCALFTIGHSNHDIDTFIQLLRRHQITVLVDVRSHPYSRYHQQFRKDPLQGAMLKVGIGYVFLGKELGPRSLDPTCYVAGQVKYEKLAQTYLFLQGLQQIQQMVTQQSIALMCAEYDPISCHRAILISRPLHNDGYSIHHILRDGTLEPHEDLEDRLLALYQLDPFNLLQSSTSSHGKSALNATASGAIAQLDLLTPLSLNLELKSDDAGVQLASLTSPQQLDLFEDWFVPQLEARKKAVAEAYRRQGEAIAYRK